MKINEFIVEGKKKVEVSTKKPIGYEISDVGKGGVEKNKKSDAEWKKQKGEDLEEGVFGNMAAAAKGAVGAAKQGGLGKAWQGAKSGWTNSSNTSGMKAAEKEQRKKIDAATKAATADWGGFSQNKQKDTPTLNAWWKKKFGGNAPRVNAADNVSVSGAIRAAVQKQMLAKASAPRQNQGGQAPSPQPAGQPTPGAQPSTAPSPAPAPAPTGQPTPQPAPSGQPAPQPAPSGQPAPAGGQQSAISQKINFWTTTIPELPNMDASHLQQMIGDLQQILSAKQQGGVTESKKRRK